MIAFSYDRHRSYCAKMFITCGTTFTAKNALKAQWMAEFLANMHASVICWAYHGPAYDWDQNIKPSGFAAPSARFPLPPEVVGKYYLASDQIDQSYYDHAYIVYFDETVYSGVMVYADNDYDAVDRAADLAYETARNGFFIPQDDLNNMSEDSMDDVSFIGSYGQAVPSEHLRIVQLY